MSLQSRVVQRARMRTLGLLGPQLARQHGLAGWLASPALNRLHREVIVASVTALRVTPGSTVADIGFGGGIGLRLLLRAVGPTGRVHGVELSPMSVRRAKLLHPRAIRSGRLQVHEAPVEQLPFRPDSLGSPGNLGDLGSPGNLDGAISVNTIHHFADLDVAFASLAAALRPEGRLVVAFPDPERQANLALTTQHGHRPRPVDEVVRRLREAGFTVQTLPRVSHVYDVLLATRVGQPSPLGAKT